MQGRVRRSYARVTGVDLNVFDRLLHFRSPDAPVLSLYMAVPGNPERRETRSRLLELMRDVCELAGSPDLDYRRRASLRSDIGRALEFETRAAEYEGQTVAVFACGSAGLYEEIRLPRRVRNRAVVAAAPYLRPLLAVLDEARPYCTVVVDGEQSWVYELFMGELQAATVVGDPGPRRRERAAGGPLGGGRVAHRVFRETADIADEFMRSSGAELLVVGGREETVRAFLPFLPRNLMSRLAGTFVIDAASTTPTRAWACAARVVERYERREEERLVGEALQRAETGELGAAGLPWCLEAVGQEAVSLLVVDDAADVPGRACDGCGWLGLEGRTCPVCGSSTRRGDTIDEMAAAVIEASGRIVHVQSPTALSQHLVAAFLRFPVPRIPATFALAPQRCGRQVLDQGACWDGSSRGSSSAPEPCSSWPAWCCCSPERRGWGASPGTSPSPGAASASTRPSGPVCCCRSC